MNPRLTRTLATAAVALFASSGVAAAKGGATPPPATPGIDCYADPAVVAISTPDVAVNYAGDAGCVGVKADGALRLAWVVTNPGWTYQVLSNGDGTNQRVQIKFTQTATGRNIDFRYELGKTRIS